jgi:hypothetical protein
LFRLQRIKANKCLIVTIQLLKYSVNFIIFNLDLLEEDYCGPFSESDKNLEYKKNKILEHINSIADFIKFLIN